MNDLKRFSPNEWQTIQIGTVYRAARGQVRLHATEPVAVVIEGPEGRAVAAYGAQVDVACHPSLTFEVVGASHVEVSVFNPEKLPLVTSEPVFTNFDKQPMVSAQVEEIMRATKLFELKQREAMLALEMRLAQGLKQPERMVEVKKPDSAVEVLQAQLEEQRAELEALRASQRSESESKADENTKE